MTSHLAIKALIENQENHAEFEITGLPVDYKTAYEF